MFEQGLFNYIVANFTVTDFDDLSVHFGEAPETAKAPYIVMYVLDSDGDPQTLCDGQYDAGDSFIQFNIYSPDMTNASYLKYKLDLFLTGVTRLTVDTVSYTISRTTHGASPSAQTLTNGLAADVLAKTFNYEKV